MIKYSPSNLAASALFLAHKIVQRGVSAWNVTLNEHTGYTESQLRPCAKDLCILLQNVGKSSLQAVKRKFSTAKYTYAAKIQLDKA